MGQYSIKDLEQLSGIKAHTLRIWEKRYAIITPRRTDTNIRFYSDNDLKKLLNITTLYNRGFKISKIADLSGSEICDYILDISNTHQPADTEFYIDQLIISMVDLDENRFGKIIKEATDAVRFEQVVVQVLYPLLVKIGVLWQTGNIIPAQEHFISNLIRQKIIAAIDALPIIDRSSKNVLLLLPENEFHEIGLLFANYLFRKNNFKTIYLGQSVPDVDMIHTVKTFNPDLVVTYIISPRTTEGIQMILDKFDKKNMDADVLISGLQVIEARNDLRIPSNIKIFSDSKELYKAIQAI